MPIAQQVERGIIGFAVSSLLENAAEQGWDSIRLAKEAGKRGLIANQDVINYMNLLQTREGRSRRASVLRQSTRTAIPQEPGALPPGIVGVEGGAAPGFEVGGGRQALVTRPRTEAEAFEATGRTIPQLEFQAATEEAGPEFAKAQRDILQTTQQNLIAAANAAAGNIAASGRLAQITGEGRPTGEFGPRDILFGRTTTQLGAVKPSISAAGARVKTEEEKIRERMNDTERTLTSNLDKLGISLQEYIAMDPAQRQARAGNLFARIESQIQLLQDDQRELERTTGRKIFITPPQEDVQQGFAR